MIICQYDDVGPLSFGIVLRKRKKKPKMKDFPLTTQPDSLPGKAALFYFSTLHSVAKYQCEPGFSLIYKFTLTVFITPDYV